MVGVAQHGVFLSYTHYVSTMPLRFVGNLSGELLLGKETLAAGHQCLVIEDCTEVKCHSIPREARNLSLPLRSEMSRFRYAPLDMTSWFY